MSDTMTYPKRHTYESSDPAPRPHDDGWTITPRAITAVATIITILYSLNTPVRYVLALASSVDALTSRVAALEAMVAHDAERHATVDLRTNTARGRGALAP